MEDFAFIKANADGEIDFDRLLAQLHEAPEYAEVISPWAAEVVVPVAVLGDPLAEPKAEMGPVRVSELLNTPLVVPWTHFDPREPKVQAVGAATSDGDPAITSCHNSLQGLSCLQESQPEPSSPATASAPPRKKPRLSKKRKSEPWDACTCFDRPSSIGNMRRHWEDSCPSNPDSGGNGIACPKGCGFVTRGYRLDNLKKHVNKCNGSGARHPKGEIE